MQTIKKEKSDSYKFINIILVFILLINTIFLNVYTLTIGLSIIIIMLIYKSLYKENYSLEVKWVPLIIIIYFILRMPASLANPKTILIDILVYILFMLLHFVSIKKPESFIRAFKFVFVIGWLNISAVLIQFIVPDKFREIIIPFFSETEMVSVNLLLNYNIFIGLTNQPAHLAGVFLICLAILLFDNNNLLFNRNIRLINLIIFIVGIILASKRAHILFGSISIIIVLLLTIIMFKHSKKVYLYIANNLLITLVTIIVFMLTFKKIDIFNQIYTTFIGVLNGDDVSNGRNILYEYAIKTFNENPFFGNGWRFIIETTGDLISKYGSAAHNIYLQTLNEFGIIGLILLILLFIYNLFVSIKELNNNNNSLKLLMKVVIFYQLFFILYGLTGNVLTDYNYLLFYGITMTITLSVKKYT